MCNALINRKKYIKSLKTFLSHLSFLCQVVEGAVLQQFTKHCKDQDLFLDYQSAYRPNYSCETALVKYLDHSTQKEVWPY